MSMQIPLASLNMNTLANLVPLSAEICGCLGGNVKNAGDTLLTKGRQKEGFRRPYRVMLNFHLHLDAN